MHDVLGTLCVIYKNNECGKCVRKMYLMFFLHYFASYLGGHIALRVTLYSYSYSWLCYIHIADVMVNHETILRSIIPIPLVQSTGKLLLNN